MIFGVITGKETLLNKVGRYPGVLSLELYKAVERLAIKLQRSVMAEKLSGQVLKNRTGNLRSSITYKIEKLPGGGAVGIVGTNVKYAGIHEFGGTIPAHDVFPKRGRVLAFDWKGKPAFFTHVHIPDVKMPERSFLRSALKEMRPEIRQALEAIPGTSWKKLS